MISGTTVAIVFILVWGIVRLKGGPRGRYRHYRDRDAAEHLEQPKQRDDPETRREIEDLRKRIRVLERIATDGNTPSARETQRIAEEIERLRDEQS